MNLYDIIYRDLDGYPQEKQIQAKNCILARYNFIEWCYLNKIAADAISITPRM